MATGDVLDIVLHVFTSLFVSVVGREVDKCKGTVAV